MLYDVSCSSGYERACNSLGVMFSDGEGSRQRDAGRRALREGVRGGDPKGCFNLANAYQTGAGVEREARRR